MGQRIKAPRCSTISSAELEDILWRHRFNFRADYIRDDTPFWKRYIFEILAANLNTEQKLLNIILCVHADGDTGENARPSLDRIQALSGLTRPTIVKHLNQGNHWVVKTQTEAGRAPNTYSVVIPQQTIDELVALYSDRSERDSPLRPSSKPDLPLADAVAVNGVNHYDTKTSRSGKNGHRSGKAALPDTIDTKHLERESNRRKSTKDRARGPFFRRSGSFRLHGATRRRRWVWRRRALIPSRRNSIGTTRARTFPTSRSSSSTGTRSGRVGRARTRKVPFLQSFLAIIVARPKRRDGPWMRIAGDILSEQGIELGCTRQGNHRALCPRCSHTRQEEARQMPFHKHRRSRRPLALPQRRLRFRRREIL